MALTQQFTSGETLTAAKLNASSIPVVSSTADITSPFTGQIVFNTTDNALYRYTGSAWAVYDPSTQWARKTANEVVNNSTTFQNDDHISFTVAANGWYALEGYFVYTSPGTADIKFNWTGPAGTSLFWTNFAVNTAALAEYNVVVEGLNAAGSARGVGGNDATTMSMQPKGVVVVSSTAGTFQLQWAQNAAVASATTMLAGSWAKLTKIA